MNSRGKKTSNDQSNTGSSNKKRRSNTYKPTKPNESGDGVDIFGDLLEVNHNKAHPALLRLSDASSPISISPRRKRSLLLKPNLIDEDGLELNDDEAEIREEKRRKELEQQKEKEKLLAEKDSLSSLNFSVLARMSSTELKEHVMQCVKLSTENKITTKNAFALQLIDCMAYMMKKDNTGSDFSTMACTLDASAKIYSHRVDSICIDMSKLIDAFLAARKRPNIKGKDGDDSEGDENDEEPVAKVHKYRRSKKNPVLMSEESLAAKPADKNFLRNFMKLEIGNGSFISKSVWDPRKKQPSLEKGIPFIYTYVEQQEETCEVDVNDFFSDDELKTISKEKTDESNINLQDLFMEAEKVEVHVKSDEEMCEEPSNDAVDADWEFHDVGDDGDDNDDVPLGDSSLHEEHLPDPVENKTYCVPDVIKQMETEQSDFENRNNQKQRTEKLQAIFDKGNSEYSYLEQTYSPVWSGPDYWKRSYKGRLVGNTKKGGKKKKDPVPLMFDIFPTRELKNTLSQKLSRKTMLNWKEKKVTVPEDLHIDPNIFVQLFFRPKDKSFIFKLGKSAGYMLLHDHDKSSAEEDTTIYSTDLMAITEEVKTFPSQDYDDGMASPCQPDNDESDDPPENMDEMIRHQDATGEHITNNVSNPDLLDGSNLIPAPKMVAAQEIKYATRPNRVDMKELKKSLHDILAFDYQNKENKGPLGERRNMLFSELYLNLQKTILTADEERRISPAMAFLGLLHLANENNLDLQNLPGNDTDFIISPELQNLPGNDTEI